MSLFKICNKFKLWKNVHCNYSAVKYHEGDQMNEQDELYKNIIIKVRGHDDEVLASYRKFISTVCYHLDINLQTEVRNKPMFERLVLNKCPFIHKKSFREYEIRTYEHTYTLANITGCTTNIFLEYIQRNIPEGVGMTVEKKRIETISDHILKIMNSPSLSEPTG